jgi:hypothetical protein
MATAASDPSGQSDTGGYNPEKIVNHRFNHKKMRTEFQVQWEGYPDKADYSWEPLENVYKCPVLIENMEKKKLASFVKTVTATAASKKVKDVILASLPRFKVLGSDVTSKFKDPSEFIPKGSECLLWVKRESLSTDNDILWKVYFKGSEDAQTHKLSASYVRKSVISYYWPVEASLFLTHVKHREACLDEYLSQVESGKAVP